MLLLDMDAAIFKTWLGNKEVTMLKVESAKMHSLTLDTSSNIMLAGYSRREILQQDGLCMMFDMISKCTLYW
jgi:hypothetical protein